MNAKPNAETIAQLTETMRELGVEYTSLRVQESEIMEHVRNARKELRKFELRAARCKTFKGRSNNEALAEYQRGSIRTGEQRIMELREEFKHVSSEISRFGDMIEEEKQGLTRRSALCDGPCTDEKTCDACTEHYAVNGDIFDMDDSLFGESAYTSDYADPSEYSNPRRGDISSETTWALYGV